MLRGKFIVFEGADRSGKTTQTRRYVDFLRTSGVAVDTSMPWRFPDRTTITGRMIDAYLKNEKNLDDRTIHLLFCANRWEKRARLLELLKAGQTVVVDRYAYSGVAYSTAKGLPIEWCKNADAGLPKPDVVVYLDLPEDVAQQRGDFGNERYENIDMQRKVTHVFKQLQKEDDAGNWQIVDANADEEIVFLRVLSAVKEGLDNCCLDKLRTLW